MNRRGFLTAMAAAPVAAVMAPAATPAFAAGGYIKPQYGYIVGQATGESILPLNTARAMQQLFEAEYCADVMDARGFDQCAAYCDELVEADRDPIMVNVHGASADDEIRDMVRAGVRDVMEHYHNSRATRG